MRLLCLTFPSIAIRRERNRFLASTFTGMVGLLLMGCSNQTSNDQTNAQQRVVATVQNVKFETKTDRITSHWGPHSKVSESNLSMEQVKAGMEFSKFESILHSQGFSKEGFIHSSHYSGKNINCKRAYGATLYAYGKVEITDGQSLLQYVEANECLEFGLLESEPTLEIYEINNAKNN